MHRVQTLFAAVLLLLVAACASLPSLEGRHESFALGGTATTGLGRAVQPDLAAHPGLSGIHALSIPSDAFGARAMLAAVAERSIDAQYYIWHGDETGNLLFEQIWRAAERGVRVRLLLDDNNTQGLDETIAALDAHPNIEIRLYNPLPYREARALAFVTDFTRVNRRMHNKSFTVDNQVTVTGGRNVGNEYFGAGNDFAFTDLDVIGIGPVVQDVSGTFDLYWNSPSAYPATPIVGAAKPDAAAWLAARFADTRADADSIAYVKVLRETPLAQQLLAGKLPFEWTKTRLVHDDPAKTLAATPTRDMLLLGDVMQAGGRPQVSFDLVSPYFVPGEEGTAALVRLAQSGVKVRVLTNSLGATDVVPVHAGYAKRRCDLLRAGVRLYELKPLGDAASASEKSKTGFHSSGHLHAKTASFDRERVFVGSFNFDLRSALLNTEMGLVIDSPLLARRLSEAFDTEIPKVAYEARIAPDGRCPEWIEQTSSGEVRHDTEPDSTPGQRAWLRFLEALPIDWLL
jgi:cardiolipin synthase C